MNASFLVSKLRFAGAALAALAVVAVPANATSLVTNGSFSSYSTGSGSGELGSADGNILNVTGWNTNGGYTWVYTSAASAIAGAPGQFGNVALWGGSTITPLTTSPDGGNFLAADGAFQTAAITQSISGLTAGANYVLSFYYAGAQQQGFDGPTTEAFTASLGSQSFTTAVLNNVSHGFTGWQQANFTFTATSATETLSFLALGTPQGVPPFSLLDGVSLNAATPEPSSLVLLGTGLASLGGFVRMRLKRK